MPTGPLSLLVDCGRSDRGKRPLEMPARLDRIEPSAPTGVRQSIAVTINAAVACTMTYSRRCYAHTHDNFARVPLGKGGEDGAGVCPGRRRLTISPSPPEKGGKGGEGGGRAVRHRLHHLHRPFGGAPAASRAPRWPPPPPPAGQNPAPGDAPGPQKGGRSSPPGDCLAADPRGPQSGPPRAPGAAPTAPRGPPRPGPAPAAVSRSPPESPRPPDARAGRTLVAGDSARRMTRRSRPPGTTGGCRHRGRP
jgi:hypothetical protein